MCQSANRKSANFNWGKIDDILSPCVYIFCNLGHALIAPPFRPWIRGKNVGKRKIKSCFSLDKNFHFLWQYLMGSKIMKLVSMLFPLRSQDTFTTFLLGHKYGRKSKICSCVVNMVLATIFCLLWKPITLMVCIIMLTVGCDIFWLLNYTGTDKKCYSKKSENLL